MEVTQPQDNLKKLKDLTTVVYALHAASFLVGFTIIIAVVINYIKRDEVKGTYLESHFNAQIKTFWVMFIGGIIGVVLTAVFIGLIVLLALAVWFIIRTVKGWLALNDGKPVA